MIKKAIAFGVLLVLFMQMGLTQDKVGNGGDVVLCTNGTVQLLDIVQGIEDWGFIPRPVTGSRAEIIKARFAEFMTVDEVIADWLQERALELDAELLKLERDTNYHSSLIKLTRRELVNIADEGVASLPVGCKIEQAASQVQSPFPKEAKFTFSATLWEKMSAETQASLILHEAIYELFISVNEVSSRSTRYYNAALQSGALDTVRGYMNISTAFAFKNLAHPENIQPRSYGIGKRCEVTRTTFDPAPWGPGHFATKGGTLIKLERRTVVKEPKYLDAMTLFVDKYTSQGLCDP